MTLRVVAALDSFKGSVDSVTAGEGTLDAVAATLPLTSVLVLRATNVAQGDLTRDGTSP